LAGNPSHNRALLAAVISLILLAFAVTWVAAPIEPVTPVTPTPALTATPR